MENLTVEQAVETLLRYTPEITETENLPLLLARNRVLDTDHCSAFDNPPFDRSPVDGYACHASDTVGASETHPVCLSVLTEIDAGGYYGSPVPEGQAVRIMTGAAIPGGCDCCIRQEDTNYGENRVCIYEEYRSGQNFCRRGEDFREGACLLKEGDRLGFVELGVLAGMGEDTVSVYRRPRVTLLTTGDEVTPPGQPLLPGKIYNSNQTLLAARMADFGVELVHVETVPDDETEMAAKLNIFQKDSDLIVTTGAVSVGKKDIMHGALKLAGAERIFWRVQMKPGMPTLFSVLNGIPVLSLSGNPFGVAVTVELLIRPMLAKMMHRPSLIPVRKQGVMQNSFPKQIRGRRYVRAFYEDGKISLPDGLHSNGVLASMQGCNCLIERWGTEPPLEAGAEAEVLLL